MSRETENDRELRKTRHIDRPLGARLRQARSTFPLSREAMAAHLGVSVATIQRFENGDQRIPAGRLWQMCHYLNLEVRDLFVDLPHCVVSPGNVEETSVAFQHDDGRAKIMIALAKAADGLETEHLEVAVKMVKALGTAQS